MSDDEQPERVKKIKLPKVAKVKNKAPAPVQITAEQLIREAKERELEITPHAPQQKITNIAELRDYQLRKRKDYEDNIRKNRLNMHNWIKYAAFEDKQGDLQRARSVYERALDVDHRNLGVWIKYAEMEMRHGQVNHARNLWDRAVTILPRANQFWYKYTYMEEKVGNIAGCRQVFERWMQWQPEEPAWHAYINFEMRYSEFERARRIYEHFVLVHPEVKNWVKYARFEERNGYLNSARKIYERAVEFYGTENPQAKLLVEFARFEEKQKEHERARVIYKYALEHLPKAESDEVYKAYTQHEKRFGDRVAIEDVLFNKRRHQYEEEVRANSTNYDAWFDYLRLMESECEDLEQIRTVYERAIAAVPPIKEKRFWRRYIYLWINYAVFEELLAEDVERCRQVYKVCLDLLPHRQFTFAKMWILYAKFEVRQKQLTTARKTLGMALGMCPKDKLYREYIELELQLREFDRCRKLYEKFLEYAPENCSTWIRFAELETNLGDVERARGVLELAINQPLLDMPERVWKAYIDFEVQQCDWARARKLYQRLLERTQHVKVWITYAHFELGTAVSDLPAEVDNPEDEELTEQVFNAAIERARNVYRQANSRLKTCQEKEQRVGLLESWKQFEEEYGTEETLKEVSDLMPQRIKRRRPVQQENNLMEGGGGGWEEYYDYVFPGDADAEGMQSNLKLLAMAKKWKVQKEVQE